MLRMCESQGVCNLRVFSDPMQRNRVAIVSVPPCKGWRSLAVLARSRLLRWALLKLPAALSLGSPHGLVIKVRGARRWGALVCIMASRAEDRGAGVLESAS